MWEMTDKFNVTKRYYFHSENINSMQRILNEDMKLHHVFGREVKAGYI